MAAKPGSKALDKHTTPQSTDQSDPEHRSRQNQARLEAIVGTAVDGIVTINQSGIIETFNRSAESIFGYRAQEVIGQNISILMPASEARLHDHYIARYLDTGKRNIIGIGREVTGQRKDGTQVPLDLSISEFRIADGRYFAGVLRDISERKEMQALLQSERGFVSAILDTSSALILVSDENARIVRFNHACEQVSGYSQQEVEGTVVWRKLIPKSHRESTKQCFGRVINDGSTEEIECPWVCKNGDLRLVRWGYTPLRNDAAKITNIIGTGIDMTEMRAAQAQSRKHLEELAHMDRVALMAEMATGLAHQLNQPLTALYAYSKACLQLLGKSPADSDKFSVLLEKISKTSERAGLTVKHLRQFTRKQEGARKPVHLHHLVGETSKLCEARFKERKVDFYIEAENNLPEVLINPVQVEQVILNLINNSLDAMAKAPVRKLTIRLTAPESNAVEIAITDTGHGFDQEQMQPIFDAFYSTKTDGMGMGLAISKTIVENHGGQLSAQNNPQGGALFLIRLPVNQESQ